MTEPAATDSGGERRFLTFRLDGQLYALPAAEVAEVIRVPAVARVPQGPKVLLGLANLRGSVLPVASGRALVGKAESEPSRAIVLNGAAAVALAVDAVDGLVAVADDRVETRQSELATDPGEQLAGAFSVPGRGDVAKVLDVWPLLQAAFVQAPRAPRTGGIATETLLGSEEAAAEQERLVTFDVAGQEFALPLVAVQEIVPMPAAIAGVPRAESVVLGVTSHRDGLLPLLSLRALLGLPAGVSDGREKIIVTRIGGVLAGLVADRMRAIVPADPRLMEPTPPMLAARTGGESRIKAIYRADGGRRLISVLAPEQLFREDVMQRLGEGAAAAPAAEALVDDGDARRFLVFRLGDDEFALPIEVVDEVARAPDQVTRVPKAPKFLEGVVNLRGEVLPVVDQRRRFDMPPATAREARRLIVMRTERHRAGLIVDSVSEVLRSSAQAIEPAPDLTGETTRLVAGVINLDASGRIVMLLDPVELLTRTERGLLDAFQASQTDEEPPAS